MGHWEYIEYNELMKGQAWLGFDVFSLNSIWLFDVLDVVEALCSQLYGGKNGDYRTGVIDGDRNGIYELRYAFNWRY